MLLERDGFSFSYGLQQIQSLCCILQRRNERTESGGVKLSLAGFLLGLAVLEGLREVVSEGFLLLAVL